MGIRVALVQLAVTDAEAPAARVDRVLGMVRDLATDHDLIVLPELWTIGAFSVDLMASEAQTLDGPVIRALAGVARQTRRWLFAGSIPELAASGKRYNTQLVLGADGQLVATYRKRYLFGFRGGETTVLSAGSDLVAIDSPLGRTGLATCYDLRFPELFRDLMEQDCQAFVVPAGWPERRIGHWQVLARARAIENQAFLLACNAVGTSAGVPLGGRSAVIDPQGEILAEAGADEEVLSVEVDLDRLSAWRAAFPALADRRRG